jgi:hypothetical protein
LNKDRVKAYKNIYKEGFMRRIVLATIFSGIMALVVTSAPVNAQTNDPGIQKRMENQENRIEQGVKSGQLTPREAGRLETEQARIQQNEERMKADGKLTAGERERLTRQQNKASKDIYRLKHNNRKANTQ